MYIGRILLAIEHGFIGHNPQKPFEETISTHFGQYRDDTSRKIAFGLSYRTGASPKQMQIFGEALVERRGFRTFTGPSRPKGRQTVGMAGVGEVGLCRFAWRADE
jgi:hypothetical protein